MPHSSGGGSHGGGSHGGGHHGGGSRGPSPTRISRTPYPGARRFRYRTRRGYRYFYTTREPGKIFHPARLLVGLIYLPFIATGVHEIAEPVQRATQKYDREIVVIDDAYVLGDESKLMTSLNAFSERTQITPAVITLYNEDGF